MLDTIGAEKAGPTPHVSPISLNLFSCCMPKKLTGPVVLIGAIFRARVVQLAAENNIKFIYSSATSNREQHYIHVCASYYILQPLDVACFARLKKAWREILPNWKPTK
jgi:hypothetical protein